MDPNISQEAINYVNFPRYNWTVRDKVILGKEYWTLIILFNLTNNGTVLEQLGIYY